MWFIGLEIGHNVMLFFVKLTLFILYFHLFGVSRKIRIFIYVGIASIFTIYAGATIVVGVFCFPRIGQSWSRLWPYVRRSKWEHDLHSRFVRDHQRFLHFQSANSPDLANAAATKEENWSLCFIHDWTSVKSICSMQNRHSWLLIQSLHIQLAPALDESVCEPDTLGDFYTPKMFFLL